MLGMRDDPQGELFFDNVRIPEHYVVVAPGFFYGVFCDQLLCLTSCGMGAFAVGLARACFEEALNYARQRVQGGGGDSEAQERKAETLRNVQEG